MSAHSYFATFGGSNPQAKYNPDRPGKVEHIFLDISLDFENESLSGTATTNLTLLRPDLKILEMQAVGMEINSISIDGEKTSFNYDGKSIFITLDKSYKIDDKIAISINYKTVKPIMGITFVKPTSEYPDKPIQAWTQGESEGSRYWYPCFDYPIQICTSEIRAKVPKSMTTVSNGNLIGKIEGGEFAIFHWKQDKPHPNYLITLTAGDFVEIKDQFENLPINYYADKTQAENLQITAHKTPKMVEFYEGFFGVKYPWAKYSQTWIHDFIWGGMENTSATINTERALIDSRTEKAQDYTFGEILIAHELCHQWFGDLIVISHWSHLWVKEGAATYSEYLWTEKEFGKDEFDYYKYLETEEYTDEATSIYSRSTVDNVYTDTEDLYDRHSYTKGGLVFNMIRTELGDELFKKALADFLTTYAHKNVDTYSFVDSIEKSTGKNLRPLFDQYIFRAGHPELKVSFSWDEENKQAKVSVVQKQALKDSKKLFSLSIPLELGCFEEGKTDENKSVEYKKFKLKISEPEQSFYFPLDKKPDIIVFDPNQNYLKTLELNLGIPELKNLLLFGPDAFSKILAAKEIAKKASLESLNILTQSLTSDRFWAVRSEIAKLIGGIKLDQVSTSLEKALADKDTRVRKSVVESLGHIHTAESFNLVYSLAEVEGNQEDGYFTESSYLKTLGGLAYYQTAENQDKAIELLSKALKNRGGWNEVVRSGAIAGLSKLKNNQKALEVLINYSKTSNSQFLKYSAIAGLGEISKEQTKENQNRVLEILSESSKESYIFAERAVISALSQFESLQAVSILSSIVKKSPYGRIKNMANQTIERILKSLENRESVAKINTELEEIKKTNQELKSKLEELQSQVSAKWKIIKSKVNVEK